MGLDREEWLSFFNARLGVAPAALARAFEKHLADQAAADAPLEVPDRMDVRYRYSYGGASRFFRALRDAARLLGARCPSCGFVWCPPRADCSRCYERTEWVELSGQGTVETWTVVHVGSSADASRVPFVCGYVRPDGADTALWQIVEVDPAVVRVGLRVEAVFHERRHGLITDFVFRPAD